MTAVVALCNNDVLWASAAQTRIDAKALIYNDIMRQLRETCGDKGINIKLALDGYDEPVVITETEYGDVIKYKEMDGNLIPEE